VLNIPTCTLLALSSNICRLFLKKNCQHKLLGFVDQCVVQLFMIFFVTKFKVSIYIALNHSHLNLSKVMELRPMTLGIQVHLLESWHEYVQ
jgi:hypothetical protein